MITVYWTRWAREGRAHRIQHRAGLELLSAGLGELYGLSVLPEELEGMLARGERGKPYLPDLPEAHFNVSHSDGVAVCAFSREEVGVDVERPAPFSSRLTGRVLTAEERAFLERWGSDEATRRELFFQLWTLKESMVKRSGEGLSRPLKSVSFSFPRYPDAGEIRCSQGGLYFVQRRWDGYILSVCSEAPIGELRLVQRRRKVQDE